MTHPNIKAVKEIDSKMTYILNDNMKSDQEKMEEYSKNLDCYLRNFKNALEVPKRDHYKTPPWKDQPVLRFLHEAAAGTNITSHQAIIISQMNLQC